MLLVSDIEVSFLGILVGSCVVAAFAFFRQLQSAGCPMCLQVHGIKCSLVARIQTIMGALYSVQHFDTTPIHSYTMKHIVL